MRIISQQQMPARTRQPAQHGVLRRRLVEMHGLRIEFRCECDDLVTADMPRPESAEPARRKIFKCQDHGTAY